MKTHSHLPCVAPCFDIINHDHCLNYAATLYFLWHNKTQEQRPERDQFDQKQNYKIDTSISPDFC